MIRVQAFAGRVVQCAFLTVIVLACIPALAGGVSSASKFIAVPSLTAPPVTGSFADLDDPAWQHGLHARDFQDFTTRTPAPDSTDAYLVFGPDAVYCAFVSSERGKIVGTQRTNNVGFGLDDYVAVMFDTSGNGTNQYFFETTPLGTRYQQASESSRYAPPWSAQATTAGNKWFAEFTIPYRFLRGSSKTWRVNFVRNVANSQQLYSWSFEGQMSSPFTEQFWPSLENAPALKSTIAKPTIQVYGLAAAGGDRRVFEGAAGQFAANAARPAGIDAKIPLTASLNFVGTLGPDFSNVENDQQVIAPQEFRYQYAEYRPFFTQGANDLPGSEVFYSPSIGIFDHGEKLEGQVSNLNVGLLNVGGFGSSDRALALAYNAPNQETSASIDAAQADRLTGKDAVIEINAGDTVHASQLSYGGSFAIDSSAQTTNAAAAERAELYAGINKPNYSLQAAYYAIGPQYQPFDAYIAQNDIRGPQISASLSTTTNATAPIRTLSGYATVDRYVDDSGAVREADADTGATLTFKNLFALAAGQQVGSLRSYANAYPAYVGGVTTPYDQSYVNASFRSGTPNTEYVTYEWGRYPTYYLQQTYGQISHQLGARYTGELDYQSVLERYLSAPQNGQTLERLTLFGTLSRDQTISLAYRIITGTGGFSAPGHNLALSYYRRFGKGNTLQAEFGSPAATRTLDRFIIKYVILIGSGSAE